MCIPMPDAKTKTETFCATESTTSLSETTLWPLPSYSIKYSMESTTPSLPHLQCWSGSRTKITSFVANRSWRDWEPTSWGKCRHSKSFQNTLDILNIINVEIFQSFSECFNKKVKHNGVCVVLFYCWWVQNYYYYQIILMAYEQFMQNYCRMVQSQLVANCSSWPTFWLTTKTSISSSSSDFQIQIV